VEAQNAAEANAKRLIATWGGWQEDYAARLWSDMVGAYYIPRLEIFFSEGQEATDRWEEEWINTPITRFATPEGDPVELTRTLVNRYK
jgi:alpha-N-acetylglucosaminidase